MTIDFPNNGEMFSGYYASCDWCMRNDYSVGSMCGSKPIGIAKGKMLIPKWRNLDDSDHKKLDGLISGDYRYGTVTILIEDK